MSTISKAASDKKASSLRKARKTTVSVKDIEKSETFEYMFDNGMKINGTLDQIEKVAATMKLKINYKSLGCRPVGFYPSTTKGMIKISEMNDYHLRRALLKEAKEYYGDMYDPKDNNKDFLVKFTGMAENPLVIELFTELSKR